MAKSTPRVQVILPTAINVLTAVNEVLLTQQRARETLSVELPSLRRRALLIVSEYGSLPFQTLDSTDDSFSR